MNHKEKEREVYTSGFPPPLPDDAWSKWGEDAVYFGAIDLWSSRPRYYPSYYYDEEEGKERGGGGEEEEGEEEEVGVELEEEEEDYYDGVDVYAINPNDPELPVYHVAHFSYMAHHVHDLWLSPACAILGSHVYVLVCGRFWFREIGGGGSSSSVYDAKWEEGPGPRGPMFDLPKLFSLKGNLYALCYVLPSPLNDIGFELFLDGREWVPLEAPPPPPPEEQKMWELVDTDHWLLGLSCIGDTKVILHVPTCPPHIELVRHGLYPPNIPYYPHLEHLVKLSGEQHFLLFQFQDGSARHGSWTRFKIVPSDSWVHHPPSPPHCCPPHRSHLDIGSPLLLPVLPQKLHAFAGFGAFDSSAFSLVEVPIIWPSQTTTNSSSPSKKKSKSSSYYHESHLNTMRAWNLFHLSGTRYCAFTFEPFAIPEERQHDPTLHSLFVCTFELVSDNGEDQPGLNLDGSHASCKPTVYAKVVSTNSEFYGFTFPIDLMAGKASRPSCASSSSF